MKKSLLFASLLASLLSTSAWAEPISSDDIQNLKATAHDVEIGLKNKDSKAVCASMNHLYELSGDLILYKSSPDDATNASMQKLIRFNTSAEEYLASCESPDAQPVSQEAMPKVALNLLRKIYPTHHAVAKAHNFVQPASWIESKN